MEISEYICGLKGNVFLFLVVRGEVVVEKRVKFCFKHNCTTLTHRKWKTVT